MIAQDRTRLIGRLPPSPCWRRVSGDLKRCTPKPGRGCACVFPGHAQDVPVRYSGVPDARLPREDVCASTAWTKCQPRSPLTRLLHLALSRPCRPARSASLKGSAECSARIGTIGPDGRSSAERIRDVRPARSRPCGTNARVPRRGAEPAAEGGGRCGWRSVIRRMIAAKAAPTAGRRLRASYNKVSRASIRRRISSGLV